MEKRTNHQKNKPKKNATDRLLSRPGITEAIRIVKEHAWLRAKEEAWLHQFLTQTPAEAVDGFPFDDPIVDGDNVDEWLESLALKAGPKIAELWELSEDTGEKLAEIIYWGESSPLARQPYFLPFIIVTNTKDPEAVHALRREYLEFGRKNSVVISPKGMQPGHLYLDVTYLPYGALHLVYKAITLCRRCLSIQKRDLREGAPETIDSKKALKCVEQADMGKPSKEIAKELGFAIYTSDNPSGSYPLFRKYIKRGREIQQKLYALDNFLWELET